MQTGQRKAAGYALPADTGQQNQHDSGERNSLKPQAPPVPGSLSPDGFSVTRVAQSHSYQQRSLGWRWESPLKWGIPTAKPAS